MVMAGKNQHGGYRRPRKPAPVSGPGELSRRTDGGPTQVVADLPNAKYGEGQEFTDLQRQIPLPASTTPKPMGAPMPTPLSAGTERPHEPISWGAPFGAGPGPSESPPVQAKVSDALARMKDNDPSGVLDDLYQLALRRGF